ncbi:hypothetical protein QVD17_15283 [Tagetes erecta]|uniref:Uncharacterized protein n=1 Tax=Tagetes erecta TaxID=13708 RepID=A0AAD8KPD8_TARER|nr:hypothetical protein QVD17_15283 [Tagetes erecta]
MFVYKGLIARTIRYKFNSFIWAGPYKRNKIQKPGPVSKIIGTTQRRLHRHEKTNETESDGRRYCNLILCRCLFLHRSLK